MWGDHLLASLRRPHHIYNPVRTGLAFLFLHLPQNDTIPQILRMRNRRRIFLHRKVWCRCSFCQHRSGFCNYGTDRLKSWISVNAMFDIFFFIRKLKEKKSSYKLRCFRMISRPVKSRNNTPQYYDNFLYLFNIVNQLYQVNKWMAKRWPFSIQGCLSRISRIMAAKSTKFVFLTDNGF